MLRAVFDASQSMQDIGDDKPCIIFGFPHQPRRFGKWASFRGKWCPWSDKLIVLLCLGVFRMIMRLGKSRLSRIASYALKRSEADIIGTWRCTGDHVRPSSHACHDGWTLIGKIVAKDMTICKDQLEEGVGQEEWWWEERTKSSLGLGDGNLLTAEIGRMFNDAVRNCNSVRLLAICVEGHLDNLLWRSSAG